VTEKEFPIKAEVEARQPIEIATAPLPKVKPLPEPEPVKATAKAMPESKPIESPAPAAEAVPIVSKPGSEIEHLKANWRQFIRDAPPNMSRTPAAALLRSAKPKAIEKDIIVLSFKYPLHKESMEKPDNQQIAEKIISSFLGRSCRVHCIYEPEDNHLIDEALKIGAQIIDVEEK
jgi:hypothetical protein